MNSIDCRPRRIVLYDKLLLLLLPLRLVVVVVCCLCMTSVPALPVLPRPSQALPLTCQRGDVSRFAAAHRIAFSS